MASMVFGSGNLTVSSGLSTDYGRGFDAFTNGTSYNELWTKRMQEGWRSAFRKEVAFGQAITDNGGNASGSMARLLNVGIGFKAA